MCALADRPGFCTELPIPPPGTVLHPHLAWHESPSPNPNQLGVIIPVPLGGSAANFNKDKQDAQNAIVSPHSGNTLGEAGFLGSVDEWKCLRGAHRKNISGIWWYLIGMGERMGPSNVGESGKGLKGGCPALWTMEGRPVPYPWNHQLHVVSSWAPR